MTDKEWGGRRMKKLALITTLLLRTAQASILLASLLVSPVWAQQPIRGQDTQSGANISRPVTVDADGAVAVFNFHPPEESFNYLTLANTFTRVNNTAADLTSSNFNSGSPYGIKWIDWKCTGIGASGTVVVRLLGSCDNGVTYKPICYVDADSSGKGNPVQVDTVQYVFNASQVSSGTDDTGNSGMLLPLIPRNVTIPPVMNQLRFAVYNRSNATITYTIGIYVRRQ